MSRRGNKSQQGITADSKGGNQPGGVAAAIAGQRSAHPGWNAPACSPESLRWQAAGVCAFLAIVVFLVFGQTLSHSFVNFDDDQNVYDNPNVTGGLTLHGIVWACTHTQLSRWAPLTALSHMLDCQLYGLWAGGHLLTSMILQAVTAMLLFLVLRQMTGALWRSASVAAWFAIHPLQVESVAWVSARSNVLSGLFFMLTLGAYARYARGPVSRGRYATVLLWFALGLLSKSILVTIPFVLLLLDYWPLGRLREASELPRLLKEKLPLFALWALSCVVTVVTEKEAGQTMESYPLSVRIGNALVACCVYLGKWIFPARLTAWYVFPERGWPPQQVIEAALLLAALTGTVLALGRKMPFLVAGWFWYLGTLVPVIGILQFEPQAFADRYTYLPQIGLCLAGAWGFADWVGERRSCRIALGAVAAAVLCILLGAAWRQTSYWRNSATLWRHALDCSPDNCFARNNLGTALLTDGRTEEALPQFYEALRIAPAYALAHYNLGAALLKLGRNGEAAGQFRESVKLDPADGKARYNLGLALLRQGAPGEAIVQFREALRIDGGAPEIHINLGDALLAQGATEEAISQFGEALKLNPADAGAHYDLGNALYQQRRIGEAIAEYRAALKLNPADPGTHYNLGNALLWQGEAREAIAQEQQAFDLQPANPLIQNNLAWMLATASQASLRNGARALELAIAASQATGGNNPLMLRTLAAAYAGKGQFAEAVQTAQRALSLAEAQSNGELVAALRREIDLYDAGRPFKEVR